MIGLLGSLAPKIFQGAKAIGNILLPVAKTIVGSAVVNKVVPKLA